MTLQQLFPVTHFVPVIYWCKINHTKLSGIKKKTQQFYYAPGFSGSGIIQNAAKMACLYFMVTGSWIGKTRTAGIDSNGWRWNHLELLPSRVRQLDRDTWRAGLWLSFLSHGIWLVRWVVWKVSSQSSKQNLHGLLWPSLESHTLLLLSYSYLSEEDTDPISQRQECQRIWRPVLKPLHQKQGRKKTGNPKVKGESLQTELLDNCYTAGIEIK